MEYPFYVEGVRRGFLRVEREGNAARISVRCEDDGRGVYRGAVVGTAGRAQLGILTPGQKGLETQCLIREMDTVGIPLRGEGWLSYSFPEKSDGWQTERQAQMLFSDPVLCACAAAAEGVKVRRDEAGHLLLAVPWSAQQPFAMTPLFCFARIRPVEGVHCAVFALDREGRPIFV